MLHITAEYTPYPINVGKVTVDCTKTQFLYFCQAIPLDATKVNTLQLEDHWLVKLVKMCTVTALFLQRPNRPLA